MSYLKQCIFLAAMLVVSVNTTAEKDLLTKRNLKALNKAIDEHFSNYPEADFSELPQQEDHSHLTILEISTPDKSSVVGWGAMGQAEGRFDLFDFLVLYNENKELVHLEILHYISSHGYQVTSKKWLRQFKGVSAKDTIKMGQQVDGISGATLSVEGLIRRLNDLSMIIDGF